MTTSKDNASSYYTVQTNFWKTKENYGKRMSESLTVRPVTRQLETAHNWIVQWHSAHTAAKGKNRCTDCIYTLR
jgi:hypothetical protein